MTFSIHGLAVARGIAIGRAVLVASSRVDVAHYFIEPTQIETEIRRRLRANFGISLARFDYMAQLYRKPDGLKMKELSNYLMVTGGNITTLTDELERESLVVREATPTDRRSWIVRLTDNGRQVFSRMAREHEQWILELFEGLEDLA